MANIDFDNPVFNLDDAEQIDDDEAPLIDPIGDLPAVPAAGQGAQALDTQRASATTATNVSLQQELLQTAVDGYYNAMAEQGHTPPLVET